MKIHKSTAGQTIQTAPAPTSRCKKALLLAGSIFTVSVVAASAYHFATADREQANNLLNAVTTLASRIVENMQVGSYIAAGTGIVLGLPAATATSLHKFYLWYKKSGTDVKIEKKMQNKTYEKQFKEAETVARTKARNKKIQEAADAKILAIRKQAEKKMT